MEESCCTCATLLSDSRRRRRRRRRLSLTPDPADDSDGSGPLDEKQLSEKGDEVPDRRLECCARVICGHCLDKNVRFATYCPYCQISTEGHDLSIPSAGLKNPPSYGSAAAAAALGAGEKEAQQQQQQQCRSLTPPPPYTAATSTAPTPTAEKQQPDEPPPPSEDVLHFLDHAHDTIPSLSLRYNIPAAALRAANRLGSDHLLPGRRVIVIPAASSSSSSSSCQTASPSTNPKTAATTTTTTTTTTPPPLLKSLSPHPVEGEAEERRKAKIRRWMVACREADYDVALLYLDQAAYDLDAAVDAYFADEAWERANPLHGSGGGGGRKSAGKPSSSSSSSASAGAGRMGFGAAAPGEGGWMWAAQAPFLRRARKKDPSDSTP